MVGACQLARSVPIAMTLAVAPSGTGAHGRSRVPETVPPSTAKTDGDARFRCCEQVGYAHNAVVVAACQGTLVEEFPLDASSVQGHGAPRDEPRRCRPGDRPQDSGENQRVRRENMKTAYIVLPSMVTVLLREGPES